MKSPFYIKAALMVSMKSSPPLTKAVMMKLLRNAITRTVCSHSTVCVELIIPYKTVPKISRTKKALRY